MDDSNGITWRCYCTKRIAYKNKKCTCGKDRPKYAKLSKRFAYPKTKKRVYIPTEQKVYFNNKDANENTISVAKALNFFENYGNKQETITPYKVHKAKQEEIFTSLFSDHQKAFNNYIKTKNSESYFNNNKHIYNSFFDQFGGKMLFELTRHEIQSFLEDIVEEREVSANTFKHYKNYCSSIFTFISTEYDILLSNPVSKVILPEIIEYPPFYLYPNEFRLFFSLTKELDFPLKLQTAILLCAHCGARTACVENLKLKGIDFEGNVVHLQSKGSPVRIVLLTQALKEALIEYIDLYEINSSDDYLFTTFPRDLFRDVKIRFLSEAKAKHKKRPLEQLTPHKLRHTFATWRYITTQDVRKVQKELGHTSVVTTEIYAQTDDNIIRQVLKDGDPFDETYNEEATE
ncbi:MAG: hypothetical protein C0602_11565 [Denitrovibrio sp.]|nr:MAG: hypothetical protein C0602_11565 [Denitrovibrio sp.]